jgi:hypothetical protein
MKQYSHILGQNIEVNDETRTVTTDDGCTYSRSEMRAITGMSADAIRGIHRIKKQFKGVIQEG